MVMKSIRQIARVVILPAITKQPIPLSKKELLVRHVTVLDRYLVL